MPETVTVQAFLIAKMGIVQRRYYCDIVIRRVIIERLDDDVICEANMHRPRDRKYSTLNIVL